MAAIVVHRWWPHVSWWRALLVMLIATVRALRAIGRDVCVWKTIGMTWRPEMLRRRTAVRLDRLSCHLCLYLRLSLCLPFTLGVLVRRIDGWHPEKSAAA